MLLGDKDTYRFAWMALNTPFYFIGKEPSSCGYIDSDGSFVGHTMIQHLPDGANLFLHRNLLKWYRLNNYEEKWQMIKRFNHDPQQKEYHLSINHPIHKHTVMNIEGDVEILDFKNIFGDIETVCLRYLEELRHKDWFLNVFGDNIKQ